MRSVADYLQALLVDADRGNDFVAYLLADSSPRGGRDWFLAELYIIQESQLDELLEAQAQLLEPDISPARRSEATRLMQGRLFRHVLVPVALGLGETGLHQKMTVLLHALRLEAHNWAMVQRISMRIVSITTDYGTEMLLHQIPPVDAGEVHPHWREVVSDPHGMVDDLPAEATEFVDDLPDMQAAAEPQQEPEAANALISLESSLPIPGCMHVLHNALDEMCSTLPDFQDWLVGAKAVSRFLSRRQSKDVLIMRCFSHGEAAAYKKKIEAFNEVIYESRFGTLLNFVARILEIKGALRFFDGARFRRCLPQQAQDMDEVGSVDIDVVCKALQSIWWWGYCNVLLSCGGVIFELQCTLQTCKCHPAQAFDLQGSSSYFRRRRAYEREAAAKATCPLKGCWAPELACGMMSQAFHDAAMLYSGHLLHDLAYCSADHRQALLAVWDCGRAFTLYVLELKFSSWLRLPLGLCCIGHNCPAVARDALRKLRTQWRQTSDKPELHAEVTREVFSTDTAEEVDAFIAGRHLGECNVLNRLSKRFPADNIR